MQGSHSWSAAVLTMLGWRAEPEIAFGQRPGAVSVIRVLAGSALGPYSGIPRPFPEPGCRLNPVDRSIFDFISTVPKWPGADEEGAGARGVDWHDLGAI
jgi:hypothetical protein